MFYTLSLGFVVILNKDHNQSRVKESHLSHPSVVLLSLCLRWLLRVLWDRHVTGMRGKHIAILFDQIFEMITNILSLIAVDCPLMSKAWKLVRLSMSLFDVYAYRCLSIGFITK